MHVVNFVVINWKSGLALQPVS